MTLRLDGRRSLFRVVIDGPRDRQGDSDVYEVLPRDDPLGTVFLPAGLEAGGELQVQAWLVVIRHPVHVVAATTRAFMEFLLLNAQAAGGLSSTKTFLLGQASLAEPRRHPSESDATLSHRQSFAPVFGAASRPFRIGSLS